VTDALRVGIAGRATLEARAEIPLPLEEMIYTVVARALDDAGLSVGEIDGVCMSASDLNDGRAISTMTLTGSTGSLGKSEMRVCNDSLAAAWLAAAEIASGAAEALVVCSWNKLSDANRDAIKPLALEPAFYRGLQFYPGAILGLRKSHDAGAVTITLPDPTEPSDAAAAVIVTSSHHRRCGNASLVGFGSAVGPYLRPGTPVLEPLSLAAGEALRRAHVGREALRSIVVCGLQEISDDALYAALTVRDDVLERLPPTRADVGYAAGLLGINHVLEMAEPGPSLVVSAGGIGLENAYAVVVEVR
jgi:hypothetical protein